ncbi:phage tail protein [Clostridium beijerinckii]|nr:phage tail protein [Clostridium beijerinckii]MZK61769.1 phage tail protein [Clostridium beijerinckii]MZK71968.1 phage tail protein [Clostridium beijerinckii]MZK77355.1 phage tail protein [Clostridium beijerinckii]MZK86939.1 phage tail protein [Clostridium beijerinckii]
MHSKNKEIKEVLQLKENKILVFNNKNNLQMGLKVVKLPEIQDSTKSINNIDIEGRDGGLTEFNKYIKDTKQVECDFRGSNPDKIIRWLRGKGPVIFGNRPDRFYDAEINNSVPLSQVIENKLYNFIVQFDCQPFGYLLDGQEIITLTNGTTLLHSKADYKSLPLITIYGTGSCTFNINGRTFTITEIGTSITIDSDIEGCYNGKDNMINGKYPYLDIGENVISWTGTGVTKVDVMPRWRCI